MKYCTACEENKCLSEFGLHRGRKDGLQANCKKCRNDAASNFYSKNRELHIKRVKYSRSRYKRIQELYGLSAHAYDNMLKEQKNSCAICKVSFETKRVNVDHDHKTGKIRGLLCTSCNTGLGKLGDSEEGLEDALAYLINAR